MTLASLNPRHFLATGTAGLALASGLARPGFSQAAARPVFTHGLQSGDVDMTPPPRALPIRCGWRR